MQFIVNFCVNIYYAVLVYHYSVIMSRAIPNFLKLFIIKRKQLDYKQLVIQHLIKTGKNLKPVKHHKNSKATVPTNISCPVCGAPHHYIYDNNGGKGQYKCKVCSTTFNKNNFFHKSVIFKCPHCGKTLEKIKDRNDFFVHKCKNNSCSFYLKNLKTMTKSEKNDFKKNPHKYKVRYLYREFKFDFKSIKKDSINLPIIDLSKKHFSDYTLGLVLSYNVNFQISARRTSELMKEIHGVSISRETILNYAKAVATNIIHYVYFFITVIRQSENRRTLSFYIGICTG